MIDPNGQWSFSLKVNASKVTARVQQGINKSIKTVKKLANPKTDRELKFWETVQVNN